MKVMVGCLEDKTFEFQGHAGDLRHSDVWPYFLDALRDGRRLVAARQLSPANPAVVCPSSRRVLTRALSVAPRCRGLIRVDSGGTGHR